MFTTVNSTCYNGTFTYIPVFSEHMQFLHQAIMVQAPQAGEAVEFLIEEGKPVEFREEVVVLAPFFGGHIIGDAKYS